MPSVGFGCLPLECGDFVSCVHKEEWLSPCVEQNCELMGKMCVRDGATNVCFHAVVSELCPGKLSVFRCLSVAYPGTCTVKTLYLKGTGKAFPSLTSGCLEDAWKHTFASDMSGCGYGRQSGPVPRPRAWKRGFMNILIKLVIFQFKPSMGE